jgi:hypothetical protein
MIHLLLISSDEFPSLQITCQGLGMSNLKSLSGFVYLYRRDCVSNS